MHQVNFIRIGEGLTVNILKPDEYSLYENNMMIRTCTIRRPLTVVTRDASMTVAGLGGPNTFRA